MFFPRSYGTGLYDQVIALTRQAGFSPRIAQEASEAMTIIGLVSAGLGCRSCRRRSAAPGSTAWSTAPRGDDCGMAGPSAERGSPLLSFIDLVTREAASLRRR